MPGPQNTAERLLRKAGTTYAEDAGIALRNTPAPLFQLLTLAMLASKPIGADIATAAARELHEGGLGTPDAVLKSSRQTMIDCFGRARYTRYDESSATRLTELSTRVREQYSGDLRTLAENSELDVAAAKSALQKFKGIGPTGADIFLREVQDVWPWVRPYFDDRAIGAARQLGLPDDPEDLHRLAPRRSAKLAAALVRVSLDDDLRDTLIPPQMEKTT
ncbi:endonuclease [Mycolicibacterium bacteremicum]|uniref:endonuclease n=1 Tax=Mycolicibacterium bacteremicum TaxID=564198 RepID=UPI0026F0AEF0|nr:endonuclease [Mycolicibacterium bacteremicum]